MILLGNFSDNIFSVIVVSICYEMNDSSSISAFSNLKNIVRDAGINYKAPSNLSTLWNFGV